MQMQRLPLSGLTIRNKKACVCVRVMRKWPFYGKNSNGVPLYVGLVLADQQGNAIYAQIPGPYIQEKSPKLELDQVYVISQFNVRPSRTSYIPFEAELMIEFSHYTQVDPADEPASAFPSCIYNIKHYSEIETTPDAMKKYIDVIGVVTCVRKPRTVQVAHQEKVATLREVIIRDLRDSELTVTLWGENIEKFSIKDCTHERPAKSIVALFVGCSPARVFGNTQVSAGDACRWFFNPEIEEAQPYYSRLAMHPVEVIEEDPDPVLPGQELRPIILEEKKLGYLHTLNPYHFPDEGCKCTVTITNIPDDNKWWYMGCELCNKKTEFFSGKYYCGVCKRWGAEPRYKITFNARDDTGEAIFFCLDTAGRQLVRSACRYLVKPLEPVQGLPKQLRDLVGKTFTFAVELNSGSFVDITIKKYDVKHVSMHPDDYQPSKQFLLPNAPHAAPAMLQPNIQTANLPHDTTVQRLSSHQQDNLQVALVPPVISSDDILGSSPSAQNLNTGQHQELTFEIDDASKTPPPAACLQETPSDKTTARDAQKDSNTRRALFEPALSHDKGDPTKKDQTDIPTAHGTSAHSDNSPPRQQGKRAKLNEPGRASGSSGRQQKSK